MTYLEKKILNGKEYYYLAETIRTKKDKWKKIRMYLGSGKKSKKELSLLMKKNIKKINAKAIEYIRSVDSFSELLSEKEIKELNQVKDSYQESIKKAPKIAVEKYFDWFITEFTYDTNAIEGSTLTLRETGLVLSDKITPGGKTLREIYEAQNHKKAFEFMQDYKGDVDKNFICALHKKLTHNILGENAGVFRKVQVFIRGAKFIPPEPEKVEMEFRELMRWYNRNKRNYHPVIVASYLHTAFEAIHPFIDGNGRVGRLLLNFILMKNKFPPINIKNQRKAAYYMALQMAQDRNLKPFVELISYYIKISRRL